MTLKECMFLENECYKNGTKIIGKPNGIVVHSTGCNNKYLQRYVQPIVGQKDYDAIIDDIGKNAYNNDWNRSAEEMGKYSCVHAFIGCNVKGDVETYQVLPYDICCWGCGSGDKGSYNYNPQARIQFEICEDDLTDEKYFNKAMKEAIEYCAYLCRKFNINLNNICSHYEAAKAGYAVQHIDPEHWLNKFGKDMVWFRSEVQKIISVPQDSPIYRVQVGAFRNKTYAEAMLNKLKSYGIDGFIVQV